MNMQENSVFKYFDVFQLAQLTLLILSKDNKYQR